MSVASQAMIDWARGRLADLDRWSKRHRSLRVTRGAVTGFMAHEALQNAGSMAYFAVLSLFQVIVLGVIVFSLLIGEGEARRIVVGRLEAALPLQPGTVSDVVDSIIASRGGITAVSIAILAWGSLGVAPAIGPPRAAAAPVARSSGERLPCRHAA